MKSAFSKEALNKFRDLASAHTLYTFDFDGTLAKIGNVPSKARMNQTTFRLLTRLSKISPIAVISGRSIKDLNRVLDFFKPHHVVGNHGLEGIDDPSKLSKAKQITKDWIRHFKNYSFFDGIEVEDKMYSLTLHYRLSKNKKIARKQIEQVIGSLEPVPRVIDGKWLLNLTPRNVSHKGDAVIALMKKTRATQAFFVGDDTTDEDVFALRNKKIMTVRVGQKNTSKAQYFIRRQSEVNRLLKAIVSPYGNA